MLEVAVHIDREIDIRVELLLPQGSTVAELKDLLCEDDVLGDLRPEDIQLKYLLNGIAADNDVVVADRCEFEICNENSSEGLSVTDGVPPVLASVEAAWYKEKPIVSGRPIRVICLHGTSSCTSVLKMQFTGLQNVCKGRVEFIYLPGKIQLSEAAAQHPAIAQMRKLFPNKELTSYADYIKTPPLPEGETVDYVGLEDVADYLEDEMRKHAPIDGVLGFSQGSNVASMLSGRAVSGHGMPLSFIVHMCSCPPVWTQRYPKYFSSAPLRIPSFHVAGEEDHSTNSGEAMAELYMNPEFIKHSGDHRPFPRDREETSVIARSILSFMERATSQ